ncbi:hypothetical protein E2P81_ATG06951 [Venturia nashicola]|nr:hypothetical protein E2P81_ATG06951 [Venturia nashicola]
MKIVTMAQKRVGEAVNFLTLPREVRQKIIHESFEYALEQDIGFNTNHAILHYLLSSHRNTCDRPVSAHSIGSWASTLAATHEIVSIDLGYVLEKRLKELEIRALESGAKPELPQGLHKWEVVSCLENFRRWTQSHVLYGPKDEYDTVLAPRMMDEATLKRRRVELQQRSTQAKRKKLLTDMVKDAVCLDNCHHVPRMSVSPFNQDAHQLRQKILHYTFYEPHLHDRAFNVKLLHLNCACNGKDDELYSWALYTHTWARTLQTTHSVVKDGLSFVLGEALQRIKAEFGLFLETRLRLDTNFDMACRWKNKARLDSSLLNC